MSKKGLSRTTHVLVQNVLVSKGLFLVLVLQISEIVMSPKKFCMWGNLYPNRELDKLKFWTCKSTLWDSDKRWQRTRKTINLCLTNCDLLLRKDKSMLIKEGSINRPWRTWQKPVRRKLRAGQKILGMVQIQYPLPLDTGVVK